MGGKKRSSESSSDDEIIEEAEDLILTSDDDDSSDEQEEPKSITPKPKKESLITKEEDDDAEPSPAAAAPVSVKPMERRKKRKQMDKERHKTEEKKVKIPKVQANTDAAVASSSSSSKPVFHISVFNDLASVDSSIREAAAETLVTELREVQKEYNLVEKKGGDDGGGDGSQLEAEKKDGLDNCASSLRYAIRRLIRGVSSSRECARQGFALGLTVVLKTIPDVKLDALMKLITDILEVNSSMKGQEAKDCLLGRLFAYGAVARSGRVAEEWISNNDAPYVKEFTSLVIALASKKRYLREPAVSLILDLAEKLPAVALSSHVVEAPGMMEWFKDAMEVGNPEALLLALKLREKISSDSDIFGGLLPQPFGPNKMFTADHLNSLVSCFKESTFCHPRVHSLWPVLINVLLPDTLTQEEDVTSSSSSSKKHKKSRKSSSSEEEVAKNLRCFCEIVIEGSLLLSSHERKNLAFYVLLLLLPRLPASCIQIVFSHKLVHCLLDILSTQSTWLYKAAQHFLKEIADWVKNDDDRRIAVIVALQKHSNGRFDCITRTKTVKDLVGDFNSESGCMVFVQNLVSMFVDEGAASEEPSDQSQTTDDNSDMGSIEDRDSTLMGDQDSLKSWVVDSLPRVIKDLTLDTEAKFRVRKEILKFLAIQGLFSASLGCEVTSFELQEKFKWPKVATSTALRQLCIEQLQLLLANTQKGEASSSQKGVDSPSPLSVPEPNDLGLYFMRFLSTLCNIPSISIYRPLNDVDGKAFKKLQEMETQLSQEEKKTGPGKEADKLHSLRYLLIQLLLQVLLRPEEFFEASFQLVICCQKSYPSPDFLESVDDVMDDSETPEPELFDVLVDALLSLLPQSSPPLRLAVEQVFKHCCNDITEAGLLRMLQVIRKDLKPARHQAADADDEDDEEEDFLNIEEEDDDGEDEDEVEETVDSDDSADDSEVAARIKAAASKELADNSDDSDSGMDDDAMFRMDSYLVKIFKEKKNQLDGGETAKSQLVAFKLRVLSLLEIYLHENPGNPQVVTVYSYLARAFVSPHSSHGNDQLDQRIWGILQKKILKSKEYPKGENIQFSVLESLLSGSLRLAAKLFKKKNSSMDVSTKKQDASLARHKMVTSLSQQATFWLLKIIHAGNYSKSDLEKVVELFQHVFVEYLDSKKSGLKPDFVKEVFQRHTWLGHKLFKFILEKCVGAKSEFRQTQALEMFAVILKSLISKKNGEYESPLAEDLIAQMPLLAELIWKLITNMPKKQSWRAQVRRSCAKIFKVISLLNAIKEFLKALSKEATDASESHLNLINDFLKVQSYENSEACEYQLNLIKYFLKEKEYSQSKEASGAPESQPNLIKEFLKVLTKKASEWQSRPGELFLSLKELQAKVKEASKELKPKLKKVKKVKEHKKNVGSTTSAAK